MRTFTFEYVPLSTVPGNRVVTTLLDNETKLKRRGFTEVSLAKDPERPDRLVCVLREQEQGSGVAGCSCPINAYMDDRLLDFMRTSSATITYEDALLPKGSKLEVRYTRELYRNGETKIHWVDWEKLSTTGNVSSIPVWVTCLPSTKIVSVFVKIDREIKNFKERDKYRLALLSVQDDVERVIRQTRTARKLIQAFRTTPANEGFVNRSIEELFLAIGQL